MKVIQADANPAGLDLFHRLPDLVYAGDPFHVVSPRRTEQALLDDSAYASRQVAFVVERDGAPLARCVARHGDASSAGTIGFFESIDDLAACRLVLQAAEQWLRERGIRRIWGPMDGDTWHRYRFNVGPRATPPFLKEPWNPDYYPALWLACDYAPADRYLSASISDPARSADGLSPFLRRVRRKGYTFRAIRKDCFDDELDVLHRLSLQIFKSNRHYTPIPLASFRKLYDGIRPLLIPGLCQFCCAPDGREIGFVFCYPDYIEAIRAMKGQTGPLAAIRFLWRRRHAARVCIKSLGCLPEYRGTGAGPALVALALEHIAALGYREALMCLMHEDNDSTRLDGGFSRPFREYQLYEKEL